MQLFMFFIFLAFSFLAHADSPITITGVIKDPKMAVTLLKVDLNQEAKKTLEKRFSLFRDSNNQTQLNTTNARRGSPPHKADLGMNGVPVLNQGVHAASSTFATVATIDALLGKGDYVSPLCSLELGSYLESNGYQPSGWKSGFASQVQNQLTIFGIVNKDTQTRGLCAGKAEYPLDNENDLGSPIDVATYHKISEPISDKVYWSTVHDAVLHHYTKFHPIEILNELKKELASGHRCTIGFLVPFEFGVRGAVGKNVKNNDTWMLTDKILYEPEHPQLGSHVIVVTGYDDYAKAAADDGHIKHGLLKLRNSWGESAGNNGDYYMTYDYFKIFVTEASCLFAQDKK